VGLAITKKVVTETGGQLYLDPGYTGGTRFLLELPVSGADLAVAGMPSVATTAPQATVLFVDDELDLAELVERVLGRAGYHVFYALSGAEALQRLAERHYDAVILDLKMPQMSGQDVYEIIQRDYPHLARRVVFTTGDTVSESARAWLEATGSLTLAKPFSIEQLAQMMDMVARRKPVLAGPRRRPA